jgi:uncharacterized membrane protein
MLRARLAKLLFELSTSYWFVPMCMMFGSMCVALLVRFLNVNQWIPPLPWVIAASTEDARAILSVIATGVLGVTGVTFSITIVAVSFASANYGPRLINNLMRDRGSQYTLGTFIGTFVYCLTALTNVHGSVTAPSGVETDSFVPHLSISVAVLLTFASISMLIYFIHHITETINIEYIVSNIGHTLQRRITRCFPESDRQWPLVEEQDFDTAIHGKLIRHVQATDTGYIQTISLKKLTALAQENDLLIRVHYRPGDFICNHDTVMTLWTRGLHDIPEPALRQCFATGQERTEHQNVLFLAEQLSEVIARALSPGTNDPFTAISCMNWFRTALINYLEDKQDMADDNVSRASFPWHRTQVQIAPIGLTRLCGVMFDETRQYVAADRNVAMHTLSLLCECASHAEAGPDRTLLIQHMDKLHRAGSSLLAESGEAAALSQRYAEAMDILSTDYDIDKQHVTWPWFGGTA